MNEGAKGGARVGAGKFRRGHPRRPMAMEEYAVDWDGPDGAPPRLRLLLLADVDLPSAGRMVEWAIQEENAFDLCAVCGDFVSRPRGWSTDGQTEEQLSAEEGEMSATLAQLENTVCRVVYIPGPLDPVIPSIRLPRRRIVTGGLADGGASKEAASSRAPVAGGRRKGREGGRGAGGAAVRGVAGNRDGVLQLTPTSKDLYRRNLRLAPGLSVAGFTEEPVEHSGGDANSNVSPSGADAAADGGLINDKTFAALRSLCRSGGGGNRRNRRRGGPSPSNNVDHGDGSGRDVFAGGQTAVLESVILLTRLGSAWHEGGTDSAGEEEETALETPGASARSAAETPPAAASAAVAAAGGTPSERAEAMTAARLRRLWSHQAGGWAGSGSRSHGTPDAEAEGEGGGGIGGDGAGEEGGGTNGSELLLHVCHGPGTFRAVRETLAASGGGGAPDAVPIPDEGAEVLREDGGRKNSDDSGAGAWSQPTPPPSEKAEGDQGRVGGPAAAGQSAREDTEYGDQAHDHEGDGRAAAAATAGVGCRIVGGGTVTALGSLRRHGAYCVVELGMPSAAARETTAGGDEAVDTASAGGRAEGGGGWSVASVKFCTIPGEGLDGDTWGETGGLAPRGTTGNFVLNF